MKIRDLIKFEIDPTEIEAYLNKLKNKEAIVTIAGEFSSGKSTFINALIGKEKFLPEALKECTPVLIDLIKSDSNKMGLVYQDGSTGEIEKNDDSIEKYARYTKEYDESIRMITVPVDSPYLLKNVHFVDTPGSNTPIKKHEDIANYIIRKSDVVLYVVNKTMNETDFNRLKYIKKYTEDIVIIISHIDEGNEGEAYKSQQAIERLVQEARDNLNNKLQIDEIDIFPVGSIQALQDDTYITLIRESIQEYIAENTANIMKKRVEKQLTLVFEKKARQLNQQADLLVTGLVSEREEIVEKVEIFEKKMNRLEANKTTRLNRLKDMAAEQKVLLSREIEALIVEYKESTITELINADVTEKEISIIFLKANESISHQLVKKTEQKIKFILEISYQEMNDELTGILESLNINIDKRIDPPKLEELDYQIDQSKMIRQAKEKENYLKYLAELDDEIATAGDRNQQLIKQKKVYEGQLQEVVKQKWSLGDFQPEFSELEVAGGGSVGAKFGRFIGEVADIALIFYNPAGGAAAAADTTKDAAKIGSLLNNAAKGKKTAGQVKKAKDIADQAKKVKEAADKASKVRNIAVKAKKVKEVVDKANKLTKDKFDKIVTKRKDTLEHLEEYKDQLPEEKKKSILDLLDYLSLGFWGENLGQTIGEQVKPTNMVFKENEARRREWEMGRESIEQSMLELRVTINSNERELNEANSIKDKRRLKLQLEEKVDRQSQLIEENERRLEKEKKFNIQQEIEAYYKNQVNQLFDAELKNIQKEVNAIMDYSIEEIEKNYRNELDKEINKLKGNVASLHKSKADLESDVNRNKELLEELSHYHSWIEEWVVAYGDC